MAGRPACCVDRLSFGGEDIFAGGREATPDKHFAGPGTRGVGERPKVQSSVVGGAQPRPIPFEDAELVERVKAGETQAYGELVRKYQDRVFNACWRICGHLEDARDLTQEAFLKAFEGLAGFRQQSGFYTWVFRVAVNLALSHRRSAKRRRTVSLESSSGPKGGQADDLRRRARGASDGDPATLVSDADSQARVIRALHLLDDEQRAVVVLRDIEGLDYHEIGSILDIPPGTVKSRLHRARMALREALLGQSSREATGS